MSPAKDPGELLWHCSNPRCLRQLLLPCCSRWLILSFGSLHHYLPLWALGAGGQPPPGPIRLLEGLECQEEGLGHWRPLAGSTGRAFSGCHLCIHTCYSLHHFWSLPAQPPLLSRAQPLAPPAGNAISLAPKLSWPIHVWWEYYRQMLRCIEGYLRATNATHLEIFVLTFSRSHWPYQILFL